MQTRIGRVVGGVACVLAVAVAAPPAAVADDGAGSVRCDPQHPQPGCTGDAGAEGSGAIGPAEMSNGVCYHPNGTVIPCQTDRGWAGADGCYYKLTEPTRTTATGMGDVGQADKVGVWYIKTCISLSAASRGLVFLTAPPVAVPELLARHARSMLRLPPLQITFHPAGDQLVGLPTWFSIPVASWQAQSATTTAPGISVTATARPVQAVWQTGDGSSVVCAGPGTPWTAGADPAAASPDCGHLYTMSSAGMPGAVYTVTVTVAWVITWTGAGRTGTVAGLTTAATARLPVGEPQAVISLLGS